MADADLNHLLVFAAVVEAGSFTAAAERLHLAKARVSQVVARLEAQLGRRLLQRTTRRLALTDDGRALYDRCLPALREVQAALGEIGGAAEPVAGPLRIAAAVDHALQSLAPAVARFALLHPAVQVELRTSDRVTDMVAEGIDLAFRVGWLRDSTLRATRLGDFEQWLLAAPAYLERSPALRRPADLTAHDWIALTLLPSPLTWRFSPKRGAAQTVRMKPRLRTDSAAALRALLIAGAGVSVLDQGSAAAAVADGRLVRLLPTWSLPFGGLHAVYPPGRHVPARTRAFVEFYKDWLAERVAA